MRIIFLYRYWLFIVLSVIGAFVVGFVGFLLYKIIKLPISKQIEKIKEWLLYATAVAEKEFGNGTGQLKLRYVYNMFIQTFPFFSKFISFNYFSSLVDSALDALNDILKTNIYADEYVYEK